MKKMLSISVIREKEIRITVSYHLTPVLKTIIKQTSNNECQCGCDAKRTSGAPLGLYMGTVTMENSMELPQNIKIKLSHDPAIPPLGIYPKETKTRAQEDTCTPMSPLLIMAKAWKQPECPLVDEWIKNCDIYFSAIKNKEILPCVTTWIDLEGIILCEISQTERDKYCMISPTCGI